METLEADFSRAEYLKDKVIPEVCTYSVCMYVANNFLKIGNFSYLTVLYL